MYRLLRATASRCLRAAPLCWPVRGLPLIACAPLRRKPRPHLRRADGLAELAGDAALLAGGVAPQHVLAAEARADRALLKRVVDLAARGRGEQTCPR